MYYTYYSIYTYTCTAFHHIEQHLNKTPNEYIRWRYANGEDKESLVKVCILSSSIAVLLLYLHTQ